MSWALLYWIAIAAIGFVAAFASMSIGRGSASFLKTHRPELMGAYRTEALRDWLLLLGLGCNLATGALAALSRPQLAGIATLLILGSATTLSGFAVLNYFLRSRSDI